MTTQEKIIQAEDRASRWLADGNYWEECGQMEKAEKCYSKSQFWLDKYNKLSGNV